MFVVASRVEEVARYRVVFFGGSAAVLRFARADEPPSHPPLDGGRLVVEFFQKVSRHIVSARALGYLATVGMVPFWGGLRV